MRIIEIKALSNGAHRNKQSDSIKVIPDGWAFVPDDITIPDTFPFVDIEVADVTHEVEMNDEGEIIKEAYTRTEVISMTAGVVPESSEAEKESVPSVMDAAFETLVDTAYRMRMLELGVSV